MTTWRAVIIGAVIIAAAIWWPRDDWRLAWSGGVSAIRINGRTGEVQLCVLKPEQVPDSGPFAGVAERANPPVNMKFSCGVIDGE